MIFSGQKFFLNKKTQILIITLICIGIYFLLRKIPASECGFLHYEVNNVTADGIELCKSDIGAFSNLEKIKFPVHLQIENTSIEKNITTTHYLNLILKNGKLLQPHEIMLSHTQKIHLMIIDNSLEDYQHIHPQPTSQPGMWKFDFLPKNPGPYTVFASFVPLRTKRNMLTSTKLSSSSLSLSYQFSPYLNYIHNNLEFTLHLTPKIIHTNQRVTFNLSVKSLSNTPIILEPIMGAYAHVVVFDSLLSGFAHLHPIYSDDPLDKYSPTLKFNFYTSQPGYYRIWAQYKINNKEIFVPFDIEVLSE